MFVDMTGFFNRHLNVHFACLFKDEGHWITLAFLKVLIWIEDHEVVAAWFEHHAFHTPDPDAIDFFHLHHAIAHFMSMDFNMLSNWRCRANQEIIIGGRIRELEKPAITVAFGGVSLLQGWSILILPCV